MSNVPRTPYYFGNSLTKFRVFHHALRAFFGLSFMVCLLWVLILPVISPFVKTCKKRHAKSDTREGRCLPGIAMSFVTYSGIFPCFLGGFLSRLFSSMSRAWMSLRQVEQSSTGELLQALKSVWVATNQQQQSGRLRIWFGATLLPLLESALVDVELPREYCTRTIQPFAGVFDQLRVDL